MEFSLNSSCFEEAIIVAVVTYFVDKEITTCDICRYSNIAYKGKF
jgi:hypothetical protein